MKYLIVTLLALSASLTACQSIPDTQPGNPVTVRFSVYAEKLHTRTDENGIADLNIYLASKLSDECLHFYTQRTGVQFSCHSGDYTLYVIANAHADLGQLTPEQIRNFSVEYDSSPVDLVMTARREITLQSSANPIELPALQVRRYAAKINYNVRVDALLPIEIRSVQLMHTPRRGTPFADKPSDEYLDAPIHENKGAGNVFPGSFYMLPNCQGTVGAIKNQKQKNPENAPRDATYLRIRAMRGSKVLDYIVYLGENNTDNFDVRANTEHTLSIFIRNDDETDVRIRSYTVLVQSKINAQISDNFCVETGAINLDISCSGDIENMKLSARLEVKRGNLRYFDFAGRGNSPIHLMSDLGKSSSFTIKYEPLTFAPENIFFDFTVHIYDRYGWVADFDFSYKYAHTFKVYTQWMFNQTEGGSISADDAIMVIPHVAMSLTFYTVYCSAEGCTLTAYPKNGRYFGGFYYGNNQTGLITMELSCRVIPLKPMRDYYVYFY